MGKIVAITGANGYLGRLLVDHFAAQHWVTTIIAIDNKFEKKSDNKADRSPNHNQPNSTKRGNDHKISHPTAHSVMAGAAQIVNYWVNICDEALVAAILAEHGVTHIIHAAFIDRYDDNLWEMHNVNVGASQDLIRTAVQVGIEHFTFLSSAAMYGYPTQQRNSVRVSEDSPLHPATISAKHKALVERFLKEYNEDFWENHVAIVRPTTILGPHYRSTPTALIGSSRFTLPNGGAALTQALHEEDAVSLINCIVEQNVTGIYNAAPNDCIAWRDVALLSKRKLFIAPRPIFDLLVNIQKRLHMRPTTELTAECLDQRSESLVVDNTKACRQIGWTARYNSRQTFESFFTGTGTLEPTLVSMPDQQQSRTPYSW